MIRQTHNKGFSLTELLLSMVVFGILMGAMLAFFSSNQKVAGEQISEASIDNNLRLALLRINELVSQASYIYPADQTLTLNAKTYTTGDSAIAILIAEGEDNIYCPDAGGQSYCGFIFSVESRAPYEAILGEGSLTTGLALVEHSTSGILWPQHGIPTVNWAGTPVSYPIADSVSAETSLGSNLEAASYNSFDRGFTFDTINSSTSLINATEAYVKISFNYRGKNVTTERSSYAYARSIPRGALPKPNQ